METARPRTRGFLTFREPAWRRHHDDTNDTETAGTVQAGAGVLAVVPLVADAVKGSGCKW
jgi:hypothetical protein